MIEENIKTGAIKSEEDSRDYIYEKLGFASTPFDWNIGFDGGNLKVKDQNGSGSCGGQAWSYYMSVLDNDNKEKSAKFIYSQTRVEPAGSAGRTNSQLCKDKGVSDEELCLSYDVGIPPSEDFMKKKDITPEAYLNALKDRAISYVQVKDYSWDNLAKVIRDNKGIVIGIYGQNNGTWLSKFPLPPKEGVSCWAHWIFANKCKIINGKKYIGFTNSWGTSVGDNGVQWISEDYTFPKIFEVWSMVYDNQEKYIFTKTLKLGSRGFDVKQLQRVLVITMDGIFGKLTKLAVQAFQLKNHLVPDGIVGDKTNSILNTL